MGVPVQIDFPIAFTLGGARLITSWQGGARGKKSGQGPHALQGTPQDLRLPSRDSSSKGPTVFPKYHSANQVFSTWPLGTLWGQTRQETYRYSHSLNTLVTEEGIFMKSTSEQQAQAPHCKPGNQHHGHTLFGGGSAAKLLHLRSTQDH